MCSTLLKSALLKPYSVTIPSQMERWLWRRPHRNILRSSIRSESYISVAKLDVVWRSIRNLPVVPVVIDPIIARRLRPHQIEGSTTAGSQGSFFDVCWRCQVYVWMRHGSSQTWRTGLHPRWWDVRPFSLATLNERYLSTDAYVLGGWGRRYRYAGVVQKCFFTPFNHRLHRRSPLFGLCSVCAFYIPAYFSTQTVIEQNPYSGIGPIVGKILIVCPVTLISVCNTFFHIQHLSESLGFEPQNWKNEFHKWWIYPISWIVRRVAMLRLCST